MVRLCVSEDPEANLAILRAALHGSDGATIGRLERPLLLLWDRRNAPPPSVTVVDHGMQAWPIVVDPVTVVNARDALVVNSIAAAFCRAVRQGIFALIGRAVNDLPRPPRTVGRRSSAGTMLQAMGLGGDEAAAAGGPVGALPSPRFPRSAFAATGPSSGAGAVSGIGPSPLGSTPGSPRSRCASTPDSTPGSPRLRSSGADSAPGSPRFRGDLVSPPLSPRTSRMVSTLAPIVEEDGESPPAATSSPTTTSASIIIPLGVKSIPTLVPVSSVTGAARSPPEGATPQGTPPGSPQSLHSPRAGSPGRSPKPRRLSLLRPSSLSSVVEGPAPDTGESEGEGASPARSAVSPRPPGAA